MGMGLFFFIFNLVALIPNLCLPRPIAKCSFSVGSIGLSSQSAAFLAIDVCNDGINDVTVVVLHRNRNDTRSIVLSFHQKLEA